MKMVVIKNAILFFYIFSVPQPKFLFIYIMHFKNVRIANYDIKYLINQIKPRFTLIININKHIIDAYAYQNW